MCDMEPAKLKVVELRAELSARGLDTKGNKAVLVKRLEDAINLEAEEAKEAEEPAFDESSQSCDESQETNQKQVEEEEDQEFQDEPVEEETTEFCPDQTEVQEPETPVSEVRTEESEHSESGLNVAQTPKAKSNRADTPSAPIVVSTKANDVEVFDVTSKSKKAPSESSHTPNVVEDPAPPSTENPAVAKMIQIKSEPGIGRNQDNSRTRWSPHVKTEPADNYNSGGGRGIKRERSVSPKRERELDNDEKTHAYWSKQDEDAKLPSQDDLKVVLDSYNSDLNLNLDPSGYQAKPMTSGGFAFVWAGARSSYGLKFGKACFEVKVIEQMEVSHLPPEEVNPHVVRVGFSCEHTSMQLGEEKLSYGYGGTGKASTDCKFKDFGVPFVAGDVVTAFINMDRKPVEVSYAVNGRHVGTAFRINANEIRDMALFPHVLTKNCSFEVNFGQEEKPSFPLPAGYQDYPFIANIPLEKLVRGTRPPTKKADCEMLMMCGLPGCGKTTWADDFCQKHPEKKYNILGTNSLIDKMKVMGLPRKKNYHGRWEVLIQLSTKCLNTLFSIGSKKLRNYILDQTNVYPTAQRRKMSSFAGFRRIAVVMVPTDEEFLRRVDKREREEGKDIPDSAVLEMKANFGLPHVGDLFDEVIFTDLPREEADKLVLKYNEEGRAVFPQNKKFRPNDNRGRDQSFSPRGGGGGDRGNSRGGDSRDRRSWSRDSSNSRDGGRFPSLWNLPKICQTLKTTTERTKAYIT